MFVYHAGLILTIILCRKYCNTGVSMCARFEVKALSKMSFMALTQFTRIVAYWNDKSDVIGQALYA